MPLFRLDGTVSLRRPLGAARSAPAGAFRVEEVPRAGLAALLGDDPALACTADDLDQVAPAPWRCFAAFAGERPVHRAFVALRPGAPLLFGAVTTPAWRGRGAFRATVDEMAACLRPAGAPFLYSSASRANRASLRAHRAAGFEVTAVRLDPVIAGVSLRSWVRRLLAHFRLQCGRLNTMAYQV